MRLYSSKGRVRQSPDQVKPFRIASENGGKHHDEAIGIDETFGFGRPIQLQIDEKDDFYIEAALGETPIDFVEDHHVPIGHPLFGAFRAFAGVVEIVRQPKMQHVRLGVLLRVLHHRLRQQPTGPRDWNSTGAYSAAFP